MGIYGFAPGNGLRVLGLYLDADLDKFPPNYEILQ